MILMTLFLWRWMRRQPATFLLHFGLLFVVAGALVTHFSGIQGKISLAEGNPPSDIYTDTETSSTARLPFSMKLDSCAVICYPSTGSPMDFVSLVEVTDGEGRTLAHGRVAMNDIFIFRHWRFYQTGIAGNRATLSISHDPWGIGLTYGGYSLVALSMFLFFFQRNSLWRSFLSRESHRRSQSALSIALFLLSFPASASNETPLPEVLQKPLADSFCRLHVCGPQRIELIETMALDFTRKLTGGSSSYRGLSAGQILTGWLFYYDSWKRVPMIRVKTAEARTLLGISGAYAALTDFFSPEGYKLEKALRDNLADNELRRLDEVVALISGVATGSAFRIFPVVTEEETGSPRHFSSYTWISWTDLASSGLSLEEWEFVSSAHIALFSDIASGHFRAAYGVIKEIEVGQAEALPESAPVVARAERVLNSLQGLTLPLSIAVLLSVVVVGLLRRRRKAALIVGGAVAGIAFVYSAGLLVLRAVVGGHWPLSDGYETLLFLASLSLGLSLVVLILRRRFPACGLLLCAGVLIGGFAMLVAHLTASSPKVTPLMPVLSSPWLAIHVMLVMASYSLMAFMAVIGGAGMRRKVSDDRARSLARLNYLILVPAVFFLMAGIMTGAVWANQSWGRYWGWDPKETCALVTLLVYAVPLHPVLLRRRRGAPFISPLSSPRRFNAWLLFSILAVAFTYFGANYLLPGLHSYA